MIGLLADHNIPRQAELIWSVFKPSDWRSLGVASLLQFSDVGLSRNATDREIWTFCQSHGLLLLTANRNDDGTESLTAVIAELNHATAYPVLTISSADWVREFLYREECAYRIADIATRIEQLQGTGRLFIP